MIRGIFNVIFTKTFRYILKIMFFKQQVYTSLFISYFFIIENYLLFLNATIFTYFHVSLDQFIFLLFKCKISFISV